MWKERCSLWWTRHRALTTTWSTSSHVCSQLPMIRNAQSLEGRADQGVESLQALRWGAQRSSSIQKHQIPRAVWSRTTGARTCQKSCARLTPFLNRARIQGSPAVKRTFWRKTSSSEEVSTLLLSAKASLSQPTENWSGFSLLITTFWNATNGQTPEQQINSRTRKSYPKFLVTLISCTKLKKAIWTQNPLKTTKFTA